MKICNEVSKFCQLSMLRFMSVMIADDSDWHNVEDSAWKITIFWLFFFKKIA